MASSRVWAALCPTLQPSWLWLPDNSCVFQTADGIQQSVSCTQPYSAPRLSVVSRQQLCVPDGLQQSVSCAQAYSGAKLSVAWIRSRTETRKQQYPPLSPDIFARCKWHRRKRLPGKYGAGVCNKCTTFLQQFTTISPLSAYLFPYTVHRDKDQSDFFFTVCKYTRTCVNFC